MDALGSMCVRWQRLLRLCRKMLIMGAEDLPAGTYATLPGIASVLADTDTLLTGREIRDFLRRTDMDDSFWCCKLSDPRRTGSCSSPHQGRVLNRGYVNQPIRYGDEFAVGFSQVWTWT